ncbi:MAG: PEP-CTERM sorting domain-containing protein [Candidatus Omnitrophica bacterium]|nr:PEP-CTERM sorting domain-containing protein [Candidatus Omnitrophota bacterium]
MRKIVLVLSLLLILAPASFGTSISFDINYVFDTGPDPNAPGPWARATFDDGGSAGTVTLTMEVFDLGTDAFISEWYFNFNTAIFGTPPVPSYVSGQAATSPVTVGIDNQKADGDGYYDIKFLFPQQTGRLSEGDTSVYLFTKAGIEATDFDFFSSPGGGNGTWPTAVHIQSILVLDEEGNPQLNEEGDPINVSSWASDGGEIPEPTSMALVTAGIVALAAKRKRIL